MIAKSLSNLATLSGDFRRTIRTKTLHQSIGLRSCLDLSVKVFDFLEVRLNLSSFLLGQSAPGSLSFIE
ncbi:hypothetical protein MOMMJLID_CDS0004 [Arthrobacter phage 1191A]|nr:hypothetical protein MOMMJLID_CDS0004 [Arthrobacter phage 1191A]